MKQRLLRIFGGVGLPVFSIVMALLIGGVLMLFLGFDVGMAYSSLVQGSLGSIAALSETLVNSTPILFTAIAYAIAFRSGLINLGGDGQLYMGAICGAFVGARFAGLPVLLHLLLIFLCAFLGGALWGFIAGFLKVKFGASELITTIMLNYIALEFLSFCVINEPFRDMTPGAAPRMAPVLESVQLPVMVPRTRLHTGILLALAALLVYYLFMWKTTKGYELRVMGQNRHAGLYAGLPVGPNAVLAFSVAGGFAGLGGAVNILGLQYYVTVEGCAGGYGFSGVSVALLGQCGPFGMLLSSVLFGALNAGGVRMQTIAKVPAATMSIVQGLIILFAVSPLLFPWVRKQFTRLRAAHANRATPAGKGGE